MFETDSSLKQELIVKPECGRGHIPPPPDIDKLRCNSLITKVVWEEQDDDDWPIPLKRPPLEFIVEQIYDSIKAAEEEADKIRRRKGWKKDTSEGQTDKQPKKGRWLIVIKHIPLYCNICEDVGDHYTMDCPSEVDKSGYEHEDCALIEMQCTVCLKEKPGHTLASCPYLYHVPKGSPVGPAGILVCSCCDEKDAHPGSDDWVGKAIIKHNIPVSRNRNKTESTV